MPSLRIYGRRVAVGSDDLAIPASFETAARFACLGSLGYLFLRAGDSYSYNSDSAWSVQAFYLGHSVLSSASLAILLATIHTSLKGTLINAWPRKAINKLITAKIVLEGVTLCFSSVSTSLILWSPLAGCSPGLLRHMRLVGGLGWGLSLWGCLFLAHVLRSAPKDDKKAERDLQTDVTVKRALSKKWSDRLHSVGRLVRLENNSALATLANLFSDFFKEEVDIVGSDLLVALMLLDKRQEERRRNMKDPFSADPLHSPATQPVSPYPFSPLSWMRDVERTGYYMRFASGAYGWPFFLFRSPLGVYDIATSYVKSRQVRRSSCPDPLTVITRTVILKTTHIQNEDIVCVSVLNSFTKLPFYVALDHKYRSIVVTIRGTLSIEDVLTDLTACASECLKVSGVSGSACVHSGMLQSARYIYSRLLEDHDDNPDRKPLLQLAREKLKETRGNQEAECYSVVVCGHSLGAGVAGILSLLLNDVFPVHCYAFSPPGGLVSLNIARHLESFVLSVVLGDDIVPRLGLINAWNLKISILNILKDCDKPKQEIVSNWLENVFNAFLGRPTSELKLCKERGSCYGDVQAQAVVEKYKGDIDHAIQSSRNTRSHFTSLYAPGCVMYIEETKQFSVLRSRCEYDAMFLRGDSKYFDEILLERTLFDHHTPWKVEAALDSLFQQNKSVRDMDSTQ